MENFKEIADKCLAGELSGIFIMRKNKPIHSNCLGRRYYLGEIIPNYYKLGLNIFTEKGDCIRNNERVEDFIPDTMTQKKIEIDIPEGKAPIMEQTENGVVISWKEKKLTYDSIIDKLKSNSEYINTFVNNPTSRAFYKKAKVIRKLTNIRNYFGKPDNMSEGWCIAYSKQYNTFCVNYINNADEWFSGILFKEGEHAEQAIKMLGDELKYLFEPW